MTDYLEVNMSALEQDISDMKDCVAKIRNEMQKMFQSVNELDTMWEGVANEIFVKQFQQDERTLAEICTAVDKVVEQMEEANTDYRRCEDEVAQLVENIRI